jgi:membrane-associated HD superfamily phosphohydrolase
MELIKTDKEVEQQELIRALEARVSNLTEVHDRNVSHLRDVQRKIAAVEKYMSENFDSDTEEHFKEIAEMLDVHLLKEFDLQVTFTTTVKVTAPIDWEREFDDAFDITVESNECEMDINDYSVDSVEVGW